MAYPIIDTLTGLYIVADGELLPADSLGVRQLQLPTDDTMYYEVIRIVDQTPLFWEDHIERMDKSINGRFRIPAGLKTDCLRLIEKHIAAGISLDKINLRIVLTEDRYVIHLMKSYYPTAEQSRTGVPVLIIDWERKDPNIKLIRSDYKAAVSQGFARNGPYGKPFELLLADQNQCLTEGSRSNLFFIEGNSVLSAPDNLILKGITRKYVIEAVAKAGAELITRMVSKTDLASGMIRAAFLSGSPIDLLPVSSIEEYRLLSASNELFLRINIEYQKILNNYIEKHKSSN